MLVPKLRFPEFTDEYKDYEFKDAFEFLTNNSYARNDLNYNNGIYNNLHYGDILIKIDNILDCNKFLLPYINDNIKIKNEVILKENDIIFADTAEDYTAGKCCEIININSRKVLAGLHTIPCRKKITVGKKYLGFYLNSYKFHKQLLPLITGTKVYGISKSTIVDTTITLPNNKIEEEKIADFLSLLDKKIELQSKKIEVLKMYKKGTKSLLLNHKIVINNNLWHEIEVGEIIKKMSEKNKNNEIEYVESISNKNGFISQVEQFEDRSIASLNKSNYYIIKKDTFAYNPSRLDVGSLALKENDKISVVSPLYECFTTNQNSEFLLEWFKSELFKKQTISKFEGGVRNTLSFNNLCKIKIMIPDKITQTYIADFLYALNKKILNETNKLELLNQLKKGLMQSMFV